VLLCYGSRTKLPTYHLYTGIEMILQNWVDGVSTLGMSAVQILEFVTTSINFGNNGYHISIHWELFH